MSGFVSVCTLYSKSQERKVVLVAFDAQSSVERIIDCKEFDEYLEITLGCYLACGYRKVSDMNALNVLRQREAL